MLELMIVVGMLAVLLTIAVPSYRGFKARALQKEGFALLSAYYMAAHNAKTDFGLFPGNFVQTGFQPVGLLGYRLQVGDNPNNVNMIINDDVCVSTQALCDCATSGGPPCPGFKTWQESPVGVLGTSLGPFDATLPCPVLAPAAGPNTVTDGTFQAVVSGVISTRSGKADRQTMNHLKQIAICEDGTL